MNDDKLSKSLNLVPLGKESKEITLVPVDMTKMDDIEQDVEVARENIRTIIQKGNDVLDDLIDLAGQVQHPRAYEVTANLIKTLLDANKDLVDLAKKKKDMYNISPEQPDQKVVNNNLFVSTTELQSMIEKMKEKKDESK